MLLPLAKIKYNVIRMYIKIIITFNWFFNNIFLFYVLLSKTPILPAPSMVLHMNGSQTSTSQSSFSASIPTVVSSISSTSPSSCSPMNGLTSSLSSNHNPNSSIPVTYAVESSLVAVDKDYQRRA